MSVGAASTAPSTGPPCPTLAARPAEAPDRRPRTRRTTVAQAGQPLGPRSRRPVGVVPDAHGLPTVAGLRGRDLGTGRIVPARRGRLPPGGADLAPERQPHDRPALQPGPRLSMHRDLAANAAISPGQHRSLRFLIIFASASSRHAPAPHRGPKDVGTATREAVARVSWRIGVETTGTRPAPGVERPRSLARIAKGGAAPAPAPEGARENAASGTPRRPGDRGPGYRGGRHIIHEKCTHHEYNRVSRATSRRRPEELGEEPPGRGMPAGVVVAPRPLGPCPGGTTGVDAASTATRSAGPQRGRRGLPRHCSRRAESPENNEAPEWRSRGLASRSSVVAGLAT